MSDQSQGEGWWQASDGKWYAPQPPGAADAPGAPPPTQPVATPPQAGAPYPPPAGPPPTQPFGPPPGAPGGPPAAGLPPGAPVGPVAGGPGAPGGPGVPGGPVGPPPNAKSGLGRGPIIGIVAAVVVVIAALAFFLTRDNSKSENVSANKSDKTDQSDGSKSDSKSSGSDNSSTTPKGQLPSGFKELTNNSEGVRIGVPKDFTQIDPSKLASNASDSDLNPQLAPFVSNDTFLQNAVLAAVGSESGTPTFAFVAKVEPSIDPTDPSVASEIETQLKAAGATDVTTDTVKLPAGDALRLGVTLQITTDSSSTVHETLFFVTVGPTTWAVGGASVGANSNSALFDQIAQTFAVTS